MALSYHILSYGIATETQIPRHDLITRNTKGDHQVHPGTTHFSVAIFPTHFSFAAEYKTEWLPRKSPFTLRHLKSRLEPRRNWALSVLPADSRSERLFSRAELIGKEIVCLSGDATRAENLAESNKKSRLGPSYDVARLCYLQIHCMTF